jgi:predicted nucleic acid-binding protein
VILIDTTPLVALCDGRDPYHGRAVDELQQLVGSRLATSEAVIAEACFHLPHGSQRRRLRALLDRLEVSLVPAERNAAYLRLLFDWLLKYADHDPDLADASLAVLCSLDPAARVWTFDGEFRTTWRRRDGTPIPPAVLG